MSSYMVKLPRGIEVDIFNLPEDFEEQIKESFKGYTAETVLERGQEYHRNSFMQNWMSYRQ